MNCGKLFQHPFRLRNHLKAHENLRDVPCNVAGCTARFNTIPVMYKHVKRKHSDTTPYLCTEPKCEQRFETPQKRLDHRVAQHKPEGHICDKCPMGKAFANKNNLEQHMKKHDEGWVGHRGAFPDCGREYSQSQSLLRHQKRDHV